MFNRFFDQFSVLQGFQSPATPIMEGIIDLHNHIFFFLIVVAVFVFYFFFVILSEFVVRARARNLSGTWVSFFKKQPPHVNEIATIHKLDPYPESRFFSQYPFESEYSYPYFFNKWLDSFLLLRQPVIRHNQRYHFLFYRVTHLPTLEIIWTLVPTFILLLIAIPSFALLYAMDEVIDPRVTVKAIGHQWYWSYEYSDASHAPKKFDSYMISESALSSGYPRLLSVDNSVVLPAQTHIRVLVTSEDVLHSWAVPSLGLKVDAVPGRLSQLALFMRREGVFYGQCSELCGVNHAFMPISVRSVDISEYTNWLKDASFAKDSSSEVFHGSALPSTSKSQAN